MKKILFAAFITSSLIGCASVPMGDAKQDAALKTFSISAELLAKLFLKRSAMTFDARISASKWLRFPFLRQSFRFTAIFRPLGRTLSPAKPV